nr:hypothetical protein [Streptomyces cyaneus]
MTVVPIPKSSRSLAAVYAWEAIGPTATSSTSRLPAVLQCSTSPT